MPFRGGGFVKASIGAVGLLSRLIGVFRFLHGCRVIFSGLKVFPGGFGPRCCGLWTFQLTLLGGDVANSHCQQPSKGDSV